MAERVKAVTWEAPEHHHIEKGPDWFWAVGIIAAAAAAAAIALGNTLLGVLILLAAATMVLFALHEPKVLPFAVTTRGVRLGSKLYPYTTLESFYIDEEDPHGPQLLIKSQHMFVPLIIIPIPEEYVDEIDDIIAERLPQEHLEESLSHRLMEFIGF